jgi:Icc-related predicted phosphoesterase
VSEPTPPTGTLTIVAISDTHGRHRALKIPPGDVLVHAGDLTRRGKFQELDELDELFASLPHRYKVVIAGNHDWCFQEQPAAAAARLKHAIYLQDEGVTLEGVRFWGSPWQPWFYDWAFNLRRGAEIRAKWELIPPDTDVLITHGPPFGHGDLTSRGERAGCEDLLEVVERIAPRVHIFGHIHEGAGVTTNGKTVFVNACSCNLGYEPVNEPVLYRYERAPGV